jgi:hypothetical protein
MLADFAIGQPFFFVVFLVGFSVATFLVGFVAAGTGTLFNCSANAAPLRGAWVDCLFSSSANAAPLNGAAGAFGATTTAGLVPNPKSDLIQFHIFAMIPI